MFETWNDTGLGAYAPTYPGDPGRGTDIGKRLIGRGGQILPEPPANCDAAYRAKYIQVFGIDPMCVPFVVQPPAPFVPPVTGPGTNNPGPYAFPPAITPAVMPSPTPVSPPVIQPRVRHPHVPRAPRTIPTRRVRPGKTSGELCPSFGHYNRPIPGVDEYQVIACTPGQPLPRINRGLQRVVRQEALARHPGGGAERAGQAGDHRGRQTSGSFATGAAGDTATASNSSGQICLSPMILLGGIAVLFFMMKR
jgi:hypothetical protein